MSRAQMEREIIAVAREVLNNPKLRSEDLLEWSTAHEAGVTISITTTKLGGVNATFKKSADKRKKEK